MRTFLAASAWIDLGRPISSPSGVTPSCGHVLGFEGGHPQSLRASTRHSAAVITLLPTSDPVPRTAIHGRSFFNSIRHRFYILNIRTGSNLVLVISNLCNWEECHTPLSRGLSCERIFSAYPRGRKHEIQVPARRPAADEKDGLHVHTGAMQIAQRNDLDILVRAHGPTTTPTGVAGSR